jgi:hypothetical protein
MSSKVFMGKDPPESMKVRTSEILARLFRTSSGLERGFRCLRLSAATGQ